MQGANRRDLGPRALLLLFGLVACLGCLGFPCLVLTPELDPSWAGVIARGHAAGARFGVDLVYTYGPLGFLITGQYSPDGFGWQFAWSIFSCVLAISILGIAASNLPSPWKWLIFPGVVLAPADMPLLACLAGSLLIAKGRSFSSMAAALLTLPFFVLLPMIKFTYALGIGASLGALAVLLVAEGRWKFASGYFSAIGGGLLLVWQRNGQRLEDLPAFVVNSMEVAKGYPASMGLPSEPVQLVIFCFLSLAAILCSFPWIPISLCRQFRENRRALIIRMMFSGILLAWTFLIWKHGMTRFSISHIPRLLTLLPFVGILGLLHRSSGKAQIWRQVALALGIVSSAIALHLVGALSSVSPSSALARLGKNSRILANPSGHVHHLVDALNAERAKAGLPETAKAIGNSSVDIFGNNQAIALLNGFNYAPRPAFQSFSAYTPALARMNNKYFLSPARPEYMVFYVDTFNNRFPPLDDGLLWPNLLESYDPILVEKNGILMRKSNRPSSSPVLLESRRITLGAPMNLSLHAGKNLFLKFDFSPTLSGSVKGIAYKPPLTILRITKADGAVPRNEFLFSYLAASSGCIISPLLTDITDVAGWMAGAKSCRPLEIVVDTMDPADRGYFKKTAGVHLYEIPPPPEQNATESRKMIARLAFGMFDIPPATWSSPSPPKPMRFSKEDFLLLVPPSEMIWPKPGGTRFVRGRLGMKPPPGDLDQKSEGAEFSVHWRPLGQTDELKLAEWDIAPTTKSGTRKPIEFSLPLPAEAGEVILRTGPGDNGNSEGDYTGWAGIRFEK